LHFVTRTCAFGQHITSKDNTRYENSLHFCIIWHLALHLTLLVFWLQAHYSIELPSSLIHVVLITPSLHNHILIHNMNTILRRLCSTSLTSALPLHTRLYLTRYTHTATPQKSPVVIVGRAQHGLIPERDSVGSLTRKLGICSMHGRNSGWYNAAWQTSLQPSSRTPTSTRAVFQQSTGYTWLRGVSSKTLWWVVGDVCAGVDGCCHFSLHFRFIDCLFLNFFFCDCVII
jgi:hypothetical protein